MNTTIYRILFIKVVLFVSNAHESHFTENSHGKFVTSQNTSKILIIIEIVGVFSIIGSTYKYIDRWTKKHVFRLIVYQKIFISHSFGLILQNGSRLKTVIALRDTFANAFVALRL